MSFSALEKYAFSTILDETVTSFLLVFITTLVMFKLIHSMLYYLAKGSKQARFLDPNYLAILSYYFLALLISRCQKTTE